MFYESVKTGFCSFSVDTESTAEPDGCIARYKHDNDRMAGPSQLYLRGDTVIPIEDQRT